MSWTTPREWQAGELVKEGDLNAQLRDNLTILIVPIDPATGKIRSLSSAYLADLSGAALTGIVKLALANDFTAGLQNFNGGATVRVVLPNGTTGW